MAAGSDRADIDRAEVERIEEALAAVDRADFLPEKLRARAGDDVALPIGHGQTNSQPTTVRAMLRALDPQPGERILDVGSGSAWTTALLAWLVTETGQVRGVELVPELVTWGRENLAGYGFDWASVEQASPDRLGLAKHAPYDRVLVSAASADVPDSLVQQLAHGGRLVAPVAGRLTVVDVRADGAVDIRRLGYYSFVPLR